MSNELKWKKEKMITYQEVDFTGNWRMAEILKACSDLATEHAEIIKVWKPEMIGTYGWILAKMALEVRHPVRFEQKIRLLTWPGRPSKVIYPRYYQIVDENGETMINASSVWTMLDLKRRRITMPARAGVTFPAEIDPEVCLELPDFSVDGQALTKVMTRQVLYSDIDTNQHMNNARYIEWVTDLLDLQRFKQGYIARLTINFKKEAAPLTIMDLYYRETGDVFEVVGRDDQQIYFEVKGEWQNSDA